MPDVGSPSLVAVRCSRNNPETEELEELPILMWLLFDQSTNDVYCRGTAGPVVRALKDGLKAKRFMPNTHLKYVFRTHEPAAAVILEVQDFLEWLDETKGLLSYARTQYVEDTAES